MPRAKLPWMSVAPPGCGPVRREGAEVLSLASIASTPLSGLRQATAPLQGPVLVALAYFLGAEVAFYIGTLSDQIFALFWPSNVILFCALLIVPQRRWWAYVAAAFPAHAAAELTVGMPAPQLLVAFATNCLVVLFNAYAVRRLVGDPPWFGNWRKAFRYIVITAGIGPALAALGGAFVPIMGSGALGDYWIYWSHWYFANALPNLTLGPAFLIWFSDNVRPGRWNPSRRHLEAVALGVVLFAACLGVALPNQIESALGPTMLLLPLPLLVWAAVRFGEKGASAAILLVAMIFMWNALHGVALFPHSDQERNLLALQLFLTGISIPILLLGALIDELRRAERTTRDLNASLVRAQDEERRRIARDLHDSTGQNLIAATLIAGRIEHALPASARPAFLQLEDMLQQSIREIRTVSYLLHPPLLDEAGLGLAVRNFVEGFSERSRITVDLELPPDLQRLSAEAELALFRVVQEALTNVSRHSGSATAIIRLAREPVAGREMVVLTVQDSGRGMPNLAGVRRRWTGTSRAPGTGVGLAGMRERLQQVGGRLEIQSAIGRTVIRATVPVEA
jgi:signal transduction histidine kinase